MKTKIFQSSELAAEYIVDMLKDILIHKPDALICLAAGHTSIPVFDRIIEEQRSGKINLSKASFVAMDEWAGVSADNTGSMTHFLHSNFLDHVGMREDQIHMFDAFGGEAECRRMHDIVTSAGGIDFLLLGMGMNGHLALNEPGSKKDSKARVVELSETTKQVSPKYFADGMPDISQGLTLGLSELLGSRQVVLAVFGEHKREAVHRFMESQPSPEFPASFIKELENAVVVFDEAAAAFISSALFSVV